MALNVKVGLIGVFDMLKFKNLGKVREEAIQKAPANEIQVDYTINANAKALHPCYLNLKVEEIVDYGAAGAKKFVFSGKEGRGFPNFRAGQYISLKAEINGACVSRPYSICSTPNEALDQGKLAITVKTNPGGFVADYLLDNIKVGDELVASSPEGQFYYESLRDGKNVIALAGGSGITPFLSMAGAITDGTEDFNLTILFGSRTEEAILFKDELASLEASSDGKVKVVHILSDEEKDGYEHGFISADIIKKYAPEGEDYSIFVCGPEAMYKFAEAEIAKLNLPKRRVRNELLGVIKDVTADAAYKGDANATYNVTVRQAGQDEKVVPAKASETLLVAFERAGIKAPSRCRSGECGWCRSQLVSGEVFIPQATDGRRESDKKWNTIHPCASFPLSDCVIEVPGEYY